MCLICSQAAAFAWTMTSPPTSLTPSGRSRRWTPRPRRLSTPKRWPGSSCGPSRWRRRTSRSPVVDGRRLLPSEAALAAGAAGIDVTAEEVLGNIRVMTWAVDARDGGGRHARRPAQRPRASPVAHAAERACQPDTRHAELDRRQQLQPRVQRRSCRRRPIRSRSCSRTCAPSRTTTVSRPWRRPRSRSPVRLGVLIAQQ